MYGTSSIFVRHEADRADFASVFYSSPDDLFIPARVDAQ